MRMILTHMWIDEKKIVVKEKLLLSAGKTNEGRSTALKIAPVRRLYRRIWVE